MISQSKKVSLLTSFPSVKNEDMPKKLKNFKSMAIIQAGLYKDLRQKLKKVSKLLRLKSNSVKTNMGLTKN